MTHKTPREGFLFSTKVVLVFVDGLGKRMWRSKVLRFAWEAVELVVILISYGSEAAVVGELPKKFCHPDSWVSPLWLTVSLFPRNVSVMGGHGCIIIIQLYLNKCAWLCKECYRPILLYPTGMWWGLKIVKCFELLGKKGTTWTQQIPIYSYSIWSHISSVMIQGIRPRVLYMCWIIHKHDHRYGPNPKVSAV